MNERVRHELLVVASSQDTIYYSELRDHIAPNLSMLAFNRVYSPIFDSINRTELAHNRPLLSSVVVNKALDLPGKGFFKQARVLGVHAGDNDHEFWCNEIKRVYDYWRTRGSG
jgi:hypothetical protein